jgi:uncharacterized protein (TIGR02172 family)
MEKGKLIGRGMTAEVYDWEQDKVLKLFFDRYNEHWVKVEAQKGSIAHNAGIPSPAVFDVINIDGRQGIILEKVSGRSILKYIQLEPWKLYIFAQKLARFHYKIHQHSAEGLPSQKDRFIYAIKKSSLLSNEKITKISDYIDSLPNGKSICHGDLHFNNVIIANDKLIAIDWSSTYQGNPLGDVARTCLMMNSPVDPFKNLGMVSVVFQYAKWLTCWSYLNEYMRLSKVKYEDIDPWLLPVAAAKLKDKVPGEEKWLLEFIDKRLLQYGL